MFDPEESRAARQLHTLLQNPLSAHKYIFGKAHTFPSPAFHEELLGDWYSNAPYVIHKAFRGAAKSTLSEEAIALRAARADFFNIVILGASETRAIERLTAIRTILNHNDLLRELYGEQIGLVDSATKIVLHNGTCIHALGKGQSLRGIKHNDRRPDLVLGDDLEDQDDVRTKEAHKRFMQWLFGEVLPSLQQPSHRVRIVGTPLADSNQCMIAKLSESEGWKSRDIPIRYFDEEGTLTSAWPEVYPLEKIAEIEARFRREGMYETFAREYLVQSRPAEGQTFDAGMFRVQPIARTWQPVYAAFDPARTTTENASFTGWAIWSPSGASGFHVWDSGAEHIPPDAIVERIFDVNEKYSPVSIGVEKDGLELFIMQPLRAEMLRRGVVMPLVPLKAPKGKNTFIEGLQPFARAGEITLNQPMPELIAQACSFPKGRNDTINALAYAISGQLHGSAVYDFNLSSIEDDIPYKQMEQAYGLLNTSGSMVTGQLVQYDLGRINILYDTAREGDPSEALSDVVTSLQLAVNSRSTRGTRLRLILPPRHFSPRDNIGLRRAVYSASLEAGSGGDPKKGRSQVRTLLAQTIKSTQGIRISPDATYTLRAFNGGYSRPILRDGGLDMEPQANIYSIFAESIESFAASMYNIVDTGRREEDILMATSIDGRSYITSQRITRRVN